MVILIASFTEGMIHDIYIRFFKADLHLYNNLLLYLYYIYYLIFIKNVNTSKD